MNNELFESVLRADLGKTAAQCGVLLGQPVHVLEKVSGDPVMAGTATLSDGGISGLISIRRRLHKQNVPCSEKSSWVVIGGSEVREQCKTLP